MNNGMFNIIIQQVYLLQILTVSEYGEKALYPTEFWCQNIDATKRG